MKLIFSLLALCLLTISPEPADASSGPFTIGMSQCNGNEPWRVQMNRDIAAAATRHPELKVVFMSGYTENAIIHHGRLDAGILLISKPFRRADLARIIRRALD